MAISSILPYPLASVLGSALAGGGGVAPVLNPLRAATVENRVANITDARGTTTLGLNWCLELYQMVGSGTLTDIACYFNGYFHGAGSSHVNLSNAYTINKIAGYVVGQPAVPFYFDNGTNRAKTINPGDDKIHTDYMAALLFWINGLPRGQEFFIKIEGTVPSTTGALPVTQKVMADSGSRMLWYNTANTTMVNGTDNTGAYTFTGTNPDSRNNGLQVFMIGHYQEADASIEVRFGSGDSIMQGLQDTVPRKTGRGWYQNYMTDAGSFNNPISSINMGVSGDTAVSQDADTQLMDYSQFANTAWVCGGTNDIGLAGGGDPAVPMAAMVSTSARMRANGCRKVYTCQLQPQATSTNPVKTVNSAPNTGWGVGEKSFQLDTLKFNGSVPGGGTVFDKFIPTPSIRQGTLVVQTEYYQWKFDAVVPVNLYDTRESVDCQHPANFGVLNWAADMRAGV